MKTFFKILNPLTYYSPLTFDTFLSQFLSKCKTKKIQNNTLFINEIMLHNVMKLPIYMIQKMIQKMIDNGLISYPSLIKWCIKTNNFEKGKQIHNTNN